MDTKAAREWTVSGPAEATPPRRPGSVRRTATIDMCWPGGWGTQMRMMGRARDLLTPAGGAPARVLAEDVLHVGAAPLGLGEAGDVGRGYLPAADVPHHHEEDR